MHGRAGPALVADIGGTHARFALVDSDAQRLALQAVQVFPTAAFERLEDALKHYLDGVGHRPREAALAVASPLSGDDMVRLTNCGWAFSQRALQAELGLTRLQVLNDFAAVAAAVTELEVTDRLTLRGDPLAPLAGPVSVLGPGTGLGVALLVETAGKGWQVVPTEGGHVSFAPLDDEERRIERRLNGLFGRVSTERVLCGDGLSQIHATLAGDEVPLRAPAAIVAAALAGSDPLAVRTLARFCAVLGSVAGDVVLCHGARTLMLAGGILPRIVPFLEASDLVPRFLAKGRFAAYLEPVAIHLIRHPHPGLLGAAVALRSATAERS